MWQLGANYSSQRGKNVGALFPSSPRPALCFKTFSASPAVVCVLGSRYIMALLLVGVVSSDMNVSHAQKMPFRRDCLRPVFISLNGR